MLAAYVHLLQSILCEKDIDSWAVPDQFLALDRDLIKLSLKVLILF